VTAIFSRPASVKHWVRLTEFKSNSQWCACYKSRTEHRGAKWATTPQDRYEDQGCVKNCNAHENKIKQQPPKSAY
jgi:hypothetical protein